jgi:hypothetical protein
VRLGASHRMRGWVLHPGSSNPEYATSRDCSRDLKRPKKDRTAGQSTAASRTGLAEAGVTVVLTASPQRDDRIEHYSQIACSFDAEDGQGYER